MVLKRLVTFVYSLVGLRVQGRIKDPASSLLLIRSEISKKANEGPSQTNSPASAAAAGLSSGEGLECEICCVCLSRLEEGEEMRILPCLHKFHKACVDRWFGECRKTCPVCRFSMRDEEERCHKREELTEEMLIWFSSFHVAGF